MQLRPFAAQWFEVVVPRTDADDTMEALARHAEVQFEWQGDPQTPAPLDRLQGPLARYRQLADEYAQFWPPPDYPKRCCELPLEAEARLALNRIERWLVDARTELDLYRQLREEQALLLAWRPILEALRESEVDLGRLARAGPLLVGLCLILPPSADPPSGDQVLTLDLSRPAGDRRIVLALAPKTELERLAKEVEGLGGRSVEIPDCLQGSSRARIQNLESRGLEVERQIQRIARGLRRLALSRGLDRSLGVLQRIDWFLHTAQDIRCDDQVCWITGWTKTTERSVLQEALREVGVEAPVAFRDPPGSAPSPSVTDYPLWLRPFQVFTQAVGVPGIREADPTTWLALLVPLLFGYMCGDLGHGLVIVVAGFLLRRRTDLWPLLVFCGIAAIGFGFLYGDVFGYEHLIEPLWVRPMEAPLLILLVPVVAGTLVLTLGMMLHLVETCWRGEGGSQGISDAAQILVYWGILLMVLDPRLGWLSVAGVVICAANQLRSQPTLSKMASGAGHLAETTFTLLLNTLSFARVGAFALAHAALESTVVTLAGSTRILGLAILIAVLGNLVVIVLEGVVVSIQTTRLVLFEFFVHFFEGEGRQFRPTAAPWPGLGDKGRH